MPTLGATSRASGQRPRASSEIEQAASRMPSWGWVLVFGLILIAGVSGIADYNLPLKSYARAVWAAVQALGGLVLFLLAGVTVSGKLRLMHQTLTLSDLLFPDRLWVLAFKSLPTTRWHVCSGVWGLAAALCGVIWVGGLTYWLPSHQPPQAVKVPYAKEIRDAAAKKDEDSGAGSDKDTPDPLAPAQPDKEKSPDEPEVSAETKRTVTKCVIVGYTEQDGDLTGLVVAKVEGDELRYVGVVPAGQDAAERKDLLTRFASLKAPAPIFPDLSVRAVWLRPRLSCEVESNRTEEGQPLKDPEFKRLVFPNKPKPVRLPADGDDKDGKEAKEDKPETASKGPDKGKAGPGTGTPPPK
jgi:hypothetical protein